MEALYKIKGNKELELVADIVKKHLLETITSDFITVDELVSIIHDLGDKLDEKNETIEEINRDMRDNYKPIRQYEPEREV